MKTPKATAGFRRHLKNHLPLLQADGLITPDQARDISQRFRLNDLAAESTRTLLMAIYIIGAFLIGIGVISFVAAHWTAIPRQVKVALLFAAMIASHFAGFYLWKMTGKSPRLGHALTILGTLIFGASIGLMAQIFHITGSTTGLFGPWAIGACCLTTSGTSKASPSASACTCCVQATHNSGDVCNARYVMERARRSCSISLATDSRLARRRFSCVAATRAARRP